MLGFDNNKLGELRPNQIITTFGPGSIVDAVKDSVTPLDLNYWREKGKKIIDRRLASYRRNHPHRLRGDPRVRPRQPGRYCDAHGRRRQGDLDCAHG